jgi:alpha-glucosidase
MTGSRTPARIHTIGRDPERTPMQWDASPGRGFSTGEPWLPYGPVEINVTTQVEDPDSMLSLYRRAIWLRKSEPALLNGASRDFEARGDVVVFTRSAHGARSVLVAVNTSTSPREVAVPGGGGTVILATDRGLEGTSVATLSLPPLGAAWVAIEG